MNTFKKKFGYVLIIHTFFSMSLLGAAMEVDQEHNGYRGFSKVTFSMSSQEVLQELHKTYDMSLLLQSIADSFAMSISLQRGSPFDADPILDRFNTINNLVITGNSVVRAPHSESDIAATVHEVAVLAEDSKSIGQAVNDIASVVSDPNMQQAAEAVSSFALTMSKTQHQKGANQSTTSYVIDLFVTVFEAATKAGVFKAIPVILHGAVEIGKDVVEIGEGVVKKVGNSQCCALV